MVSSSYKTLRGSLFPHSLPRCSRALSTVMPESLPILKGTLDALVLRTLSWGAMHGFEITTWLEERSGGRLDVDDRALYQALQRLEERGFVETEWGITDNNRRARYYKLTAAGRAHLREETKTWVSYAEAVTDILTVAPTTRRTT